jgi:hypothetical protein
MNFLILGGGVLAVLFLVAYIRAGRFGATVLALGVGYLLALMWTDILLPYAPAALPYMSRYDTVYAFLIVVPGIVTLLFSPKHKSVFPKIITAFAVAALGVVLLLPVFESASQGSTLYTRLQDSQGVIITGLLLLGLLDVAFARFPKPSKPSKD